MNDRWMELDSALRLVREAFDAKRPPNHYHARAVLLPLGALLASDAADAARERVRWLGALTGQRLGDWTRAVVEELELALAEYVRSVDPRYLGRPDYDFRYTEEARALLADRLRAADEFGLAPTPEAARQLESADRRLAPYLERRRTAPDA